MTDYVQLVHFFENYIILNIIYVYLLRFFVIIINVSHPVYGVSLWFYYYITLMRNPMVLNPSGAVATINNAFIPKNVIFLLVSVSNSHSELQ